MMQRKLRKSGRTVAGFSLLAAVLFYISGAALLVHLELDHTHRIDARTVHADRTQTPGEPRQDAPADTPSSPSEDQCHLCEMIAGSTRWVAIVQAGPALFTMPDSLAAPILIQAPPKHLHTRDISRRGPPSLG